MKKRRFDWLSAGAVLTLCLLILAAYGLGLLGPRAEKEKAKKENDGKAFVIKLVESLNQLQDQVQLCEQGKARYLARPERSAIAKGLEDTEALSKMLSNERLWLAQQEEDADKRWNENTRLTIKRFRELAEEWRVETTKIEAQATALRKFWEAEKAKNR
ncbi:MAG: hypothetical protein C5B53_06925 [Candidatus Melainabacteria bacterium]|nr:MAG: hypothetical protein C5B53_06925 [Candidatus Melainabacteria bacterium]